MGYDATEFWFPSLGRTDSSMAAMNGYVVQDFKLKSDRSKDKTKTCSLRPTNPIPRGCRKADRATKGPAGNDVCIRVE